MAILSVSRQWSRGTRQNDRNRQFYAAAAALVARPLQLPGAVAVHSDAWAVRAHIGRRCCCYALNATTDVQRRLDAADSPHAGQQPIPHAVRIHFVAPELSAQHPVLLPRPNHHEHGVRCPWQQR